MCDGKRDKYRKSPICRKSTISKLEIQCMSFRRSIKNFFFIVPPESQDSRTRTSQETKTANCKSTGQSEHETGGEEAKNLEERRAVDGNSSDEETPKKRA